VISKFALCEFQSEASAMKDGCGIMIVLFGAALTESFNTDNSLIDMAFA